MQAAKKGKNLTASLQQGGERGGEGGGRGAGGGAWTAAPLILPPQAWQVAAASPVLGGVTAFAGSVRIEDTKKKSTALKHFTSLPATN